MKRRIDGSIVVITGASSGIGRATAVAFVQAGARVVLAARREDALEEVAAECRALAGRDDAARVVVTDVTDPDAVERLAGEAVAWGGRLDIWVNNAGVGAYGKFEDVPADAVRRIMDVNFQGVAHGSRAAIARFRAQGGGTLIQVASIAGRVPHPYFSAYVASKHAVIGLSLTLRQELGLEGDAIQVCTVCPAAIDTPFYDHAAHYGGLVPRVMPPVYAPEQVARAILRVARRPRRMVFVGFAGKLFLSQWTLLPDTTERQLGRLADRMLVEHDPAYPDDDATLYEPMAEGRAASAGWQPRPSMARRALALGLVALGGAVILVPGAGRLLAAALTGAALGVGVGRRPARWAEGDVAPPQLAEREQGALRAAQPVEVAPVRR